jgi:hypothetical protein
LPISRPTAQDAAEPVEERWSRKAEDPTSGESLRALSGRREQCRCEYISLPSHAINVAIGSVTSPGVSPIVQPNASTHASQIAGLRHRDTDGSGLGVTHAEQHPEPSR